MTGYKDKLEVEASGCGRLPYLPSENRVNAAGNEMHPLLAACAKY